MSAYQLRTWGWRVGLLMMIVTPIIYTLTLLTLYVGGESNVLTRIIMYANDLLPSAFLSIGAGAAVCLLVRIETHLDALRSKD